MKKFRKLFEQENFSMTNFLQDLRFRNYFVKVFAYYKSMLLLSLENIDFFTLLFLSGKLIIWIKHHSLNGHVNLNCFHTLFGYDKNKCRHCWTNKLLTVSDSKCHKRCRFTPLAEAASLVVLYWYMWPQSVIGPPPLFSLILLSISQQRWLTAVGHKKAPVHF